MLMLVTTGCSQSLPDGSADGQVHALAGGSFLAWDAVNGAWLEPESFWLQYAARRGGLSWGQRSDYPPYNEVKEFDTMIIELESGPCLMEFFHQRWRRANDVRRWGPAFNDYGGCPYVFD